MSEYETLTKGEKETLLELACLIDRVVCSMSGSVDDKQRFLNENIEQSSRQEFQTWLDDVYEDEDEDEDDYSSCDRGPDCGGECYEDNN